MKVVLNPSDVSLDPDPALAASDPLIAAFDLFAIAIRVQSHRSAMPRADWATRIALRLIDRMERGERVSLPEIAVEVCQ